MARQPLAVLRAIRIDFAVPGLGRERVAALTGAAYQAHEHTTVARRVGFTDERIEGVAHYPADDSAGLFTDFERTLLEFTDAVVHTTTAPDELFEAVRAEYDDSRLVELVLVIGFYLMVGRVMNTFQLELQTEPVGNYRLRLE